MKFFRFFIIFLSLAILTTGCSFFAPPAGNNNQDQSDQTNINPQLEAQYRQQIAEALQPFWQSNEVNGIREKVLDIRTPSAYLDLHLDIVLAFDKIEQGQATADQALIEEGFEKLNDLKDQYPWLAE